MDPGLGFMAFRILAAHGLSDEARHVLRTVAESTGDAQLDSLRVLSEGQSGDKPIDIEALAASTKTLRSSVNALAALQKRDWRSSQKFLTAKIEEGGPHVPTMRLLRAVLAGRAATRINEDNERRKLTTQLKKDLESLANKETSKGDLVSALRVAFAAKEHEVAGRLAALVLGKEGEPNGIALRVIDIARSVDSQEARGALSTGLRAEPVVGSPKAIVAILLDAIKKGSALDVADLRSRVEEAANEESSRFAALFMGLQLAARAKDADGMLTHAKRLYEFKDTPMTRLVYGDVLLKRGDNEAVVKLHGTTSAPSGGVLAQQMKALTRLERTAESAKLARKFVGDHPYEATGYLLLANSHLVAKREREALGVLAMAPLNRDVAYTQARILLARGDIDNAEILLRIVLDSDPTDIVAWRAYAGALKQGKRVKELIDQLSKTIQALQSGATPNVLSELHSLRAGAYGDEKQYKEARADYERAIESMPNNAIALNNLAWHIHEHAPDDRSLAVEYVAKALAVAPGHPQILHSSAIINEKAGNLTLATQQMATAAKGAKANPERAAKYMIDHAALIKRAGADGANEKYTSILEEVIRKFPSTEAASEARSLLQGR